MGQYFAGLADQPIPGDAPEWFYPGVAFIGRFLLEGGRDWLEDRFGV